MATVFLKEGTSYIPFNETNLETHTEIPPGVYLIREKPMGGPLYFDRTDDFTLPSKMYGDTEKVAERILTTFWSRAHSTGVMLSGEKGSGKTLLAKTLSVRSGLPVILINAPYHGDKFNAFMQSLAQPAVVLFDEFEKVYDEDTQPHMLTLLDGVFATKKLFVLTCNDKYRVNEHMKNRPGRLFYALDFKGLSQEFIVDYCNDRLDNKEHINALCSLALLFEEFNFDMLQALVEEMNRYKENPHEAVAMLNIKVELWKEFGSFQAEAFDPKGKPLLMVAPRNGVFLKNPAFHSSFELTVDTKLKSLKPDQGADVDEDGDEIYHRDRKRSDSEMRLHFTKRDLKSVDAATSTYTFVNATGFVAKVSKMPPQAYGNEHLF